MTAISRGERIGVEMAAISRGRGTGADMTAISRAENLGGYLIPKPYAVCTTWHEFVCKERLSKVGGRN